MPLEFLSLPVDGGDAEAAFVVVSLKCTGLEGASEPAGFH